jgi:hypothetical protein
MLKLQTCIINLTTLTWGQTRLHGQQHISGVPAATVLALQLFRAWNHWKMFPSLRHCRVISSEWEPTDEDLELHQFFDQEDHIPMQSGGITEIVSHDILNNRTSVYPFRSIHTRPHWRHENRIIDDICDRPNSPGPRRQKIYEWRSDDNVPYVVSIEQIEPVIEGYWTIANDGTRHAAPNAVPLSENLTFPIRQRVKYPHHHPEVYEGLLDRIGIRERRIECGEDWRYNTL